MKIRTEEELKLFEDAINQCAKAVLLLMPDGRQYDLKTARGRYMGIAGLLNHKGRMEPEIYTSSIGDEMILFDYFEKARKIA